MITTREAFLRLKPTCDELMKKPCQENANNVISCIKNLPNSAIQDLIEYICYPVIVHLQTNSTNKNVKIDLINVLKMTLDKSKILGINSFIKLYICLISQIYDDKQPTKLISAHEELKENVIQCLKKLMVGLSIDVIELLYTRENASKISQSIYMCLSIAKHERNSSLRIEGIEALMALSYIHDEADSTDIVIRSQVADIMMLFLPGIVRTLQDISQGSDIQNHKVTTIALKALGRIITIVMEDMPQDELQILPQSLPEISKKEKNSADPLGIQMKLGGEEGMKNHIKTAIRDENFYEAASEKLNIPLRNLINLTKHAHFRVRKELVETVGLFLTKCARNMNICFSDLVEIIISLSEDDSEDVKNPARKILNDINKNVVANHQMRSLMELLEENFYKLLTKLPRIIRRSDDASQISYLNQLAGYLRILGKERLPQIMVSIPHLRRLILALVYVVEFDCTDVSVLEDNRLKTIEDTTHLTITSWKKFKFISDAIALEKLMLICKFLGEMGDLAILVDSIFELMSDTPQYRKELIFLLNCIFTSEKIPNLSMYQQIIDHYIENDLWYSSIQVQENNSLRQVQSNIIQSCLLTEGLGIFAFSLKSDYQRFLLKTLYMIIERVGSGNGLISLIGLQTLKQISKSQGHEIISDLLRENVDYISYHVTIKLRRVEKNPGVLDVVTTVMEYSTMDFLPCLREIVEDALAQLAVNFQEANSYPLLKVLHTFTVCLRNLVSTIEFKENYEKSNEEKLSEHEEIIQNFLEYYEAKKVSEDLENDDLGGTAEDIEEELNNERNNAYDYQNTEDETKEPPEYVKLIENVMKRCLHFLPSKDIPKTLLAMQTLHEGLYILADFDEQLLPIVHQLWHPLVDRFKDNNILIINRAWQLLWTLAHLSKDFIRSRTLKQIFPPISIFLKNSSMESYKKDSKNAYKFTQMFKLQKQILVQLGQIAIDLKLQERELWKLLEITEPYLSCYQHPELQECCRDLYKKISDFNGDIVWIKCLSIWNIHVRKIPADATLKLSDLEIGEDENPSEFGKNVENVLHHVHEITYKNSNNISHTTQSI